MKLCIILSHILLSIPLIGATVAYQHWFTRKDKISKFLETMYYLKPYFIINTSYRSDSSVSALVY